HRADEDVGERSHARVVVEAASGQEDVFACRGVPQRRAAARAEGAPVARRRLEEGDARLAARDAEARRRCGDEGAEGRAVGLAAHRDVAVRHHLERARRLEGDVAAEAAAASHARPPSPRPRTLARPRHGRGDRVTRRSLRSLGSSQPTTPKTTSRTRWVSKNSRTERIPPRSTSKSARSSHWWWVARAVRES